MVMKLEKDRSDIIVSSSKEMSSSDIGMILLLLVGKGIDVRLTRLGRFTSALGLESPVVSVPL